MTVAVELQVMVPKADRQTVITEPSIERDKLDDDFADLLSDPHCRHLLNYLRERNDPATVSTITKYVVAQITDTSPEEVSENVQRRVGTWLHHGQLPALDDYGVVDFDPESGTVSLIDDPST
jgi:hypothetical protein